MDNFIHKNIDKEAILKISFEFMTEYHYNKLNKANKTSCNSFFVGSMDLLSFN